MSRVLYVDAVAGVAGDMLLGALLDAGADEIRVREGLRGLGVDGLDLSLTTEHRHGIAARRVTVTAAEQAAGVHRTWADVRTILDRARLPDRARERAHAVFRALAEAEGRVHAVAPEAVRFHEVGAIDAIADVCGIALALEDLAVDELACSPLPAPRGFVRSAHGRLPLPAPATLELLRGAPLHGLELDAELVTPTGAAVVAALAGEWGPLPPLRLDAVGYGAGARELEALPNVVRVVVGERLGRGRTPGADRPVSLIETNLDDLSPELVPDAAERCFDAGALDVWVTPATMKKGRPGLVLSALARPADERAVAEAVLRETTTLGVRISAVRRWELEREWRTVEVDGERVRIKAGSLDGRIVNAAPEHDDCAAVARRTGRPVKQVWADALAAATREART
jgi:pyridinium-3,5-bisthiocarboxylic acid mononucleotide nickel chelatase